MLIAKTAAAQNQQEERPFWYIGGAVHRNDVRFQPHYTLPDGSDPSDFDNRAHGIGSDTFIGREHRITDRVSIGGQVTLIMMRAVWRLTLDEPADFAYRLPYTVVASVLPEEIGRAHV